MFKIKMLGRKWGKDKGKAFQVWATANTKALKPKFLVGVRNSKEATLAGPVSEGVWREGDEARALRGQLIWTTGRCLDFIRRVRRSH